MRWWTVTDRTAATAPARLAFFAQFARQVDPDGVLSPTERAARVEALRKAYFGRISLKRWRKKPP